MIFWFVYRKKYSFSDCKVNEKEMVRVQNRTSCHFFSLVHDILAYHYKNRKSHFLLQVE